MASNDFIPDDNEDHHADDFPPITRGAWEAHLSHVIQPQIDAFTAAYTCQLHNPNRIQDIAAEFKWNTTSFADDLQGEDEGEGEFGHTAPSMPAGELYTFFDSPAYLISVALHDMAEEFLTAALSSGQLATHIALKLSFNLGRIRCVHIEMLANAEYYEGALVQCQVIRTHPLWNTAFNQWLALCEDAPKNEALQHLGCILHDYRESLFLLKQTADNMVASIDTDNT
jgi:hypothetical protein